MLMNDAQLFKPPICRVSKSLPVRSTFRSIPELRSTTPSMGPFNAGRYPARANGYFVSQEMERGGFQPREKAKRGLEVRVLSFIKPLSMEYFAALLLTSVSVLFVYLALARLKCDC